METRNRPLAGKRNEAFAAAMMTGVLERSGKVLRLLRSAATFGGGPGHQPKTGLLISAASPPHERKSDMVN